MSTIIDFTGFRENLRDCLRAGLREWYDADQINFNSALIPNRSSEYVEVYLAGTAHEPLNLGKNVPHPDTVNVGAEVVCVSPNIEIADAIIERDILLARTIKGINDHKHNFFMPGLTIIGSAFNDRTDDNVTTAILAVNWKTVG